MDEAIDYGERSVDDLLEEMRGRAREEREQILMAAKQKAAQITEKSRREAARLEQEALAEVEARLVAERDRVVGVVRAQARVAMLDVKRSAIEEVFTAAKREIETRIGSDGYREALAAMLREALSFTGGGAEITVSEEDLALCGEIVSAQSLDCELRGTVAERGTLVARSADGRREVENGFSLRLGRARRLLSAEVARVLFESPVRPV